MSKHELIFSTLSFRRKAEECPLMVTGGIGKQPWFCGTFEAEYEVSFEPGDPTQWWISDASLVCCNLKTDRDAASNIINLDADADRHFYLMILDSIDHKYGRKIPEWIEDEIALLGIVPLYERVA